MNDDSLPWTVLVSIARKVSISSWQVLNKKSNRMTSKKFYAVDIPTTSNTNLNTEELFNRNPNTNRLDLSSVGFTLFKSVTKKATCDSQTVNWLKPLRKSIFS